MDGNWKEKEMIDILFKEKLLYRRNTMKKALLLIALLLMTLACSVDLGLTPTPDTSATGNNSPNTSREESSRNEEVPARSQDDAPRIAEDETYIPDTSTYSSSDSELVYFDDFSNSNSGWDRINWDNGYTDYHDSAYLVAANKSYYDIWANPGLYYSGDVQVEVEATLSGGENDNNFGILCRYSGTSGDPNFYFFEISSDGYAVIGVTKAGISEYLSAEKMMPTNAINQGYATNYLRANCIGSQLTFYVNGVNVASASDSSFVTGDVGLIAGTFDAAYTEVTFDNFAVYTP